MPATIPDLAAALAAELLNDEYAELAHRMAATLARLRPSPFERGEPRTWAAAVVHAAGWVNFLDDPAQSPHMAAADLARRSGVAQGTVAARFREIRERLDLVRMDPEWTLPSRMADNPLVWMALVDGVAVDLRDAPRDMQEEALARGIIPFLPPAPDAPPVDDDPAGPLVLDAAGLPAGLREEVERVVRDVLERDPGARDEDLGVALAAFGDRYNRTPQPELFGLAPVQLARLAEADWKGGDGAIRVDDRLPPDELAGSRTLHDARVLLDILAAPEGVKATPKGNLPRRVVEAFRARMRPPTHRHDAWEAEATVRNEEDLRALHVVRVLLELGGLVKRRRGVWSRTRRGEALAAPDRAGALQALLLRTHFRALDLAYLDGAPHVPLFQATVGIPLYRLTQLDDAWRAPDALVDLLIPPDLRADLRRAMEEGLARPLGFDGLPLVMETRLLRPLARFGLLDQREPARDREREVGAAILRDEYRPTPLLARAFRFDLDLADAGA